MDMEGLHQTQLDLDAFDPPNTQVGDQSASAPNSPSLFSGSSNDEVSGDDSEPSFFPPWYKHGSSANRANKENSPDLAEELPRWMQERRSSSRSALGSIAPRSSYSRSRSFGRSPMVSPHGDESCGSQNVSVPGTPRSSPSSSESSMAQPTPTSLRGSNGLLRQILSEVQQTNKKFDSRLKDLEKKIDDIHGCEDPLPRKRKKLSPSPEIRNAVRTVYRSLQENDPEFGWDTLDSFSEASNQGVLSKLVHEVKTQMSQAPSSHIREAAKTYFASTVGLAKMKQSGKYQIKCTQQRRKNRILRKLTNRVMMLKKTSSVNEEAKEKWMPCLTPELMSSEESGEDDDGEFTVRPLLWRSDKVSHFLMSLDHKHDKYKTTRSKRMSFTRKQGLPSDRVKPHGLPAWVFK